MQEKENVILHYTKEAVQQGSMVQGAIDYERRFQFMQQHSGEHIVSGIVHSLYGYDNVGFHLGSDSVTMDFNGMLTPEDIVKIESLANEAVYKNVPILETYPSSQELEQQIIGYKVKEIADGTQNLCLFEEHMDASKLRPYCNALMEKCTGVVAVFTGDDSTGYKYVIGSKTSDVRELGNKLKEQFQSQGGGSKEMIQGSLIGIKEEIQQILLV